MGLALALALPASSSRADAVTGLVPELDPQGHVYKTEGPTDHKIYPKAEGLIKAAMIFVDFPDVPADGQETQPIADHLLGSGKAQQFFKDTSYGKMSLEVSVINGWKRMPRPVGKYVDSAGGFDFERHKAYITDACALFPEVDFSAWQFVYVVAVKTKVIALSPAFNAYPGDGVKTAHGEVRLAVTFGNDSYHNRHTTVIHETGHLLGLPDVYRYGGGLSIGPWDIMCDIFKGTSFLGWHRHKLGWLDKSRELYLKKGTSQLVLTPLSSTGGVSMVVVPADDSDHPSKVIVAEIAQPILSAHGKMWGDGVLIYSVDATIPTGKDPVVIYPKQAGDSEEFGRLYQASFNVGDDFQPTNAPVEIKVLEKQADGYKIEVTRR
jgi:M6 family metalloprotease-like protein